MAKKDFLYRGKVLSDLQGLSTDEISNLLTSRARRCLKRGITVAQKTLLDNLGKTGSVKTHCRDIVILPEMVGKTIGVYTGKDFINIVITFEMIGHKLGEFAMTRKRAGHSGGGIGGKKKK